MSYVELRYRVIFRLTDESMREFAIPLLPPSKIEYEEFHSCGANISILVTRLAEFGLLRSALADVASIRPHVSILLFIASDSELLLLPSEVEEFIYDFRATVDVVITSRFLS